MVKKLVALVKKLIAAWLQHKSRRTRSKRFSSVKFGQKFLHLLNIIKKIFQPKRFSSVKHGRIAFLCRSKCFSVRTNPQLMTTESQTWSICFSSVKHNRNINRTLRSGLFISCFLPVALIFWSRHLPFNFLRSRWSRTHCLGLQNLEIPNIGRDRLIIKPQLRPGKKIIRLKV